MTIPEIIRAVQAKLGVTVDGFAGPETWGAIYKHIVEPDTDTPPVQAPVDERSEKNIATLHPRVQPLARALVQSAAAQGITIKIIDGSRTYAEQDALYAKGRTKPGEIVTNAKGGQSWHNFSLAFDVGVFSGNRYVPESPLYQRVGVLGKALGFEWGGDWRGGLVDEPHFQFNPAHLTIAQLRQRHDAGEDLFA